MFEYVYMYIVHVCTYVPYVRLCVCNAFAVVIAAITAACLFVCLLVLLLLPLS